MEHDLKIAHRHILTEPHTNGKYTFLLSYFCFIQAAGVTLAQNPVKCASRQSCTKVMCLGRKFWVWFTDVGQNYCFISSYLETHTDLAPHGRPQQLSFIWQLTILTKTDLICVPDSFLTSMKLSVSAQVFVTLTLSESKQAMTLPFSTWQLLAGWANLHSLSGREQVPLWNSRQTSSVSHFVSRIGVTFTAISNPTAGIAY